MVLCDTMQMVSNTEAQPTIAIVKGERVTILPHDLYIPPDALEIFLDAFEGPLDLLLYLIKKENLDILDIPIAEITRQYMQYVEMMQALRLELAGDYLVMAAMLAEIKSRLLLPRPEEAKEEEDPRAELVRRLQEYERFKRAAADIDALPRVERDIFLAQIPGPENLELIKPQPTVDLRELLLALKDVFERARLNAHHHLKREALSIRERMSQVLSKVTGEQFIEFKELFDVHEGRMGVVVTFIAILELIRQSVLELIQTEAFAPIHVKAVS